MGTTSTKKNPLVVAPREIVVELYPGDAEQQLRNLYEQLDIARADEQGQRRMGALMPADAIAEQIDQLVAEVESKIVKIRLREVEHRVLNQISDDCPPREDNKRDALLGVNEEDYYRRAIAAAIVHPKVTAAQFAEFADSVGRFNWTKLREAIDWLATEENPLPKSSAVSTLAAMRESDSKRREPTG